MVRVPGGAVDRAGHRGEHGAQHRVVRALLDGAQARAHAREELRTRERPVQVVVGADVVGRLGGAAPRGPGEGEEPGAAEARVLAQDDAGRGRLQPAGLAVDDHQLRGLLASAVSAAAARGAVRIVWPSARSQEPSSGSAAPTTSTPA